MPAGCFAVFWDIYSFLHDDALGMRDRMLAQRAICAALEPRRDARCVERMRTGQQHHLCPCSHLIDANRADVQLLFERGLCRELRQRRDCGFACAAQRWSLLACPTATALRVYALQECAHTRASIAVGAALLLLLLLLLLLPHNSRCCLDSSWPWCLHQTAGVEPHAVGTEPAASTLRATATAAAAGATRATGVSSACVGSCAWAATCRAWATGAGTGACAAGAAGACAAGAAGSNTTSAPATAGAAGACTGPAASSRAIDHAATTTFFATCGNGPSRWLL